MSAKFYVDGNDRIFSVHEETDFFRLTVSKSSIEDEHVEDFMDTTVEWLSSDPQKGILIDFSGVEWICDEFVSHLATYYADLKKRGIYVRFVNVQPEIKPYVDISDITVVMPMPQFEKASISAKVVLQDLANQLSDSGLMRKHGLSPRGLASMYRKLLSKGLIDEDMIEQRRGSTTATIVVPMHGQEEDSNRKVVIDAAEAVKDVLDGMADMDLMAKYRLSKRGLHSMISKLWRRGLVDADTYRARMGEDPE